MSVTSVLVAGSGPDGYTVARALARSGVEVGLIDRGDAPVDPEVERAARVVAVDVRRDVTLVGVVEVDSHVEAEQSDERVENYDAIVIVDPRTAAGIVASDRVFVLTAGADAQWVVKRIARRGASDR